MGTRGTIAIQNEDGTVTGIYTHWDSYLSHNGEILQNHCTTEAAARELCQLRGQDPDELEAYNNGTMAYAQQARWRNAQTELEYFVSMMHTINKHKLVEKSDG